MTTNTTLSYISNHPMQHKVAAYRYYINRMIAFMLNEENRNKEWNIICNIAHNNKFSYNKIKELKNRMEHNKTHHKLNDSTTKMKWVTFTYYSPQIRKITNMFKHTDLKIAFKNSNNIQQLTKPKNNNKTEYYNHSGIYALTCKTCKHIRGTNKQRFKTKIPRALALH
jgi:hypothetical protein